MRCFPIQTTAFAFMLSALSTLPVLAGTITFGSGGNQFMMEFVTIGNAGNTADTTGDPNPAGAVGYSFEMGKFEVSEDMITKANSAGSLGITTSSRSANKPATNVTWFEAAKFVNWLNTSQGFQAAYNFDGSGNFQLWSTTETWQLDGQNRFRHKDAQYFLPSVDEWYKAAYHNASAGTAGTYFNYPTGSNGTPDGISSSGDTTFDAVFKSGFNQGGPNDITNAGILSPYGTMGQGGNVWEWEETEFDLTNDSGSSARGLRGGNWGGNSGGLSASLRFSFIPRLESSGIGFRVARHRFSCRKRP